MVRLLRGLTIGAVVRGNNPHGQPELQQVRGRVVVATDHPSRSLFLPQAECQAGGVGPDQLLTNC